MELVSFVNAAYAGNPTTHRSITGFAFCMAGTAVAFKSKLQPTVSTSSTESKLIAAAHAAKVGRYLRSILVDLGFPPDGPTCLYEDNAAAINIINKEIPTERTRHCDIQFFALQEWYQRRLIDMVHIPGTINPADACTKALGWTLHHRHVRRSMGHCGPPH